MASCRRGKSEADAGRDLISELPAEVKERILECLPTREAARTALLSTHWNNVWLRHGRLVFDWDFFQCFSKYKGEKGISKINTINDILMLRVGLIKKFTLYLYHASHHYPQQSDLDRWCRFLSRNGLQELSLFISRNYMLPLRLPSCIFSCRTIKQLYLGDFIFDFPIPSCIFPSVTSLAFKNVEFSDNVKGIVYTIPNIEELSFSWCKGISNFEISSPKLESLRVIGPLSYKLVESRWLTLYLKTIKTLCLSANLLLCKNAEIATVTFPTAINLQVIELYDLSVSCQEQLTFVLQLLQHSPNLCELKIGVADDCMHESMFPTAINLRVLKLYELDFGCRKQLIVSMQLLQKCPNLCELWIMVDEFNRKDDQEGASRLLEDRNGCLFIQELQMLNTIKIEAFSDQSAVEMLFVKTLLSKSPGLERVVIVESLRKNASEVVRKIQGKLECFPRASPNAQIVCTSNDYARMSEDWMDTHGVSLD